MDIVNFEISQKCHEISEFLQKPERFHHISVKHTLKQYPVILGKSRTFGFYCANATRFEAYTYVIMSCCGQYMT